MTLEAATPVGSLEADRAPGLPRYVVRPPRLAEARELGRALDVGATLAQVLLHRGIDDVARGRDFLEARLTGLTSPAAMADRDAASERLARAVRARERVVVFGDYDVDGTTSAAILGGILSALGADVRVLIANRFEGGYGFSDPALARALEAGPSLIVTCDCGSSDHERVSRARARGVDVIVIDHHLVPEEPLAALAFINPHRPECGFPYKGLASAGLALSIGAAVRAAVGSSLDVRPWLDLVALGTVADVAPLDGDNRRLVRAGLARIISPAARPGVVALRELARIREGAPMGAPDIAFRLAPRLNAAGRLGDPAVTLRLLQAGTLGEARTLAARVEQINEERRTIERRITEEAIAQVLDVYGERVDGGLVVASSSWHRGVVGIVAARLVDRFGVPAVVVALEGGRGHGSARTPEGLSVYEALCACRELLGQFGGHAAAAGLSLSVERLDAFRAGFGDACRAQRASRPSVEVALSVDVVLGDGFELPTARELAMLEPVGERNEEPRFLLQGARVESSTVVGDGHLKLALRLGDKRLSAFGWDMGSLARGVGATVDVIGALRPDAWRGGDAVELRVSSVA
jgi:single-stranded-DNA-specific exonuclease